MSESLKEQVLRRIRTICQANGPESLHPGRASFSEIHEDVREFVRPMKGGTLRSIIKDLIKEGTMNRFREKGHTYRPVALDRVTFGDLLNEAKKQIDPSASKSAGRRATVDGSREVETISLRQWERIRAALRKVTRSRHPKLSRREAMAQPASDLFHWAPDEGPGGAGDWHRLVRAMEQASQPSTRSDDVSAIRILADLSASHGWIPRSDRHDPTYSPVPASWAPIQESWRTLIYAAGLSRAASISMLLLTAVSELFGDAVEPSGITPDQWTRVRAWVEEEMLDRDWHTSARSQLRRGFQVLREAGTVEACEWEAYYHRGKRARTLITRKHRMRIAQAYGRQHREMVKRADRLAAIDALPASLDGLKKHDSPFGLHQALEHFTRKGFRLGRDIPARGVYPNEQHRQSRPSTWVAWTEATVYGNLEMIGYVLGWMATEEGVDWATSDLSHLGSPDTVSWVFEQTVSGAISEDRGGRILALLARIASPYLEAVATKLGDSEMADGFAKASKLASSTHGFEDKNGSRHVSLARQLKEGTTHENEQIEKARAKARKVEKAYRRETGEGSAYKGMWKIFRHARREFLDRVGAVSSAELSALEPSSLRARAGQLLRDLVYFQDQLMVPLRAQSSRLMTLDMRDPDMSALYPPEIFKVRKNGSMEARYASPSRSGPYDVDLWHAYVRPGGVRELELERRGEQTDAVYVAFGRETHEMGRDANGSLMLVGRRDHLCGAVKRVLEASRLGGLEIDPQALIAEGVAATHQFRHAVATWLCAKGKIQEAAMLLHHASMDMVARVYAAQTAADGNVVMIGAMDDDE